MWAPTASAILRPHLREFFTRADTTPVPPVQLEQEQQQQQPRQQQRSCPICMDALPSEYTKCGHGFCRKCLDSWTERNDSCPLCRTELDVRPSSSRGTTLRPDHQQLPPVAPRRTYEDAAAARRAVIEREHEERQSRRERQVQLERRLDSYRSNIWTPSGRPYESLPVVSLTELRNGVLNSNKRALAGAIASSYERSW